MKTGLKENVKESLHALAHRKEFWIAVVLYALAAAVIGMMFASCAAGSVWWDEYFSFWLTEQGYLRLVYLTAHDVHPPLYYCMLKFCIDATSLVGADRIVVAKCFSVFPYVALWVYSLIFVRRDFGWIVSGAFALLIVTMPNLFTYASEIRMYSWSMGFVTAALIHLYQVIKDPNSIFAWCALSFHTLCAAYTQYFALLSVFFLWLGLFIYLIVRNRRALVRFAIFEGATVLLYAPWMYYLLQQINTYSEGSSGAVNWGDWQQYYVFAFYFPAAWKDFHWFVSAICLVCLALAFVRHRLDAVNLTGLIGIATFLAVSLSLTLIPALTNHPVFNRYIFPALGCVWYPVCVMSARLFENPFRTLSEAGKDAKAIAKKAMPFVNVAFLSLLTVCLAISGSINTVQAWKAYAKERDEYYIYRAEVLDKIGEDDIVVADGVFARTALTAMLGSGRCYAYGPSVEESWVVHQNPVMWEADDMVESAQAGKTVWLFASDAFPADALALVRELCEENGISFETLGRYTQVDSVDCAHSDVYKIG